MKRILFTLLFFCVAATLFSCRKNADDMDIKTYDEQQIQAYIKKNALTGFQRDLSNGDTTGIYYKVLKAGTGKVVDYPSKVAVVFTIKSFDGQYLAVDTFANHILNFVGHIDYANNRVPKGFMLVIKNILKTKGSSARFLLPSRLGYGTLGTGTGSAEGTNRVAGNQSLDCYINIINDDEISRTTDPVTNKPIIVTGVDSYDDMVCRNYIASNNLTGYTQTASGLYYKITQEGSGATVTGNDVVDLQYSGYLLNGYLTGDNQNSSSGYGASTDLSNDLRKGFTEGLKFTKPGTKISLIMPSRLAYGMTTPDASIPVFSCMRYDINVLSIL